MTYVPGEILSIEPDTVYPEGSVWTWLWTIQTRSRIIHAYDHPCWGPKFQQHIGSLDFVLQLTGLFEINCSERPGEDPAYQFAGRLGELIDLDDLEGSFLEKMDEFSFAAPDYFVPYYRFETEFGTLLLHQNQIDREHRTLHERGQPVFVQASSWLKLIGICAVSTPSANPSSAEESGPDTHPGFGSPRPA